MSQHFCTLCGEQLSSGRRLRKHVEREHNENVYSSLTERVLSLERSAARAGDKASASSSGPSSTDTDDRSKPSALQSIEDAVAQLSSCVRSFEGRSHMLQNRIDVLEKRYGSMVSPASRLQRPFEADSSLLNHIDSRLLRIETSLLGLRAAHVDSHTRMQSDAIPSILVEAPYEQPILDSCRESQSHSYHGAQKLTPNRSPASWQQGQSKRGNSQVTLR